MIFGRLKKPDQKKEDDLREQLENSGGVEKKDMLAMILSAFLVIIPVAALALGVMVLFMFLFLG